MQRVIKLFLIFFIIVGGFYIFKVAYPYLNKRELVLENGTDLKENFYVIKVFILKNSNTLSFNIPNFSDYVKFIFTPNIVPQNKNIESISNLYTTLEYTLFYKDSIIAKKRFTFKSNYIQYIDKNGTIVKPIQYANSNLTPISSAMLKINLNGYKSVDKIEFKIISKDKNIVDISLRGYFLERNKKEKIKKLWGHMPIEKKVILFSDNVYPLYYISQIEKEIRLQAIWKPNAPIGILGKSYEVRNMLKRKDFGDISPIIHIKPIIYSDKNLIATRYLNRGRYRLFIKDTQKDSGNIEVSLYKDLPIFDKNYSISSLKLNPLDLNITSPAILALKSDIGVSYTIIDKDKNQALYLPPKSSLYYKVDSNSSLDYNLLPTKNRVVKLEVRSKEIDKNVTIKIILKDNNKTVKSLEQNLTFKASSYDYIDNFNPVSKPIYYILPLDDNISLISIKSSSLIFIKLYSRNLQIPYPKFSYKSITNKDFTKIPTWFTLRPKDFSILYMKNLSKIIYKQKSLPNPSPYTKMGLYKYNTLYPNNRLWQGYTILQKRAKDIYYIRQKSWSSIYANIKRGDKIILNSDEFSFFVNPKLVVINSSKKDYNISLDIDNNNLLNETINSKIKIFTLPSISTKTTHTISVSSDSNRTLVFISNCALKDRTFIQKSFVLLNKPLFFNLENIKLNDANKSIKIEFAIEDNNSSNIKKTLFKIDGNNQFKKDNLYNKFTFSKYLLFSKAEDREGFILNDKAKRVNNSNAIYIPLGNNLKDGNYSLSLYPYRYNKRVFVNLSLIGLGKQEDITIQRSR